MSLLVFLAFALLLFAGLGSWLLPLLPSADRLTKLAGCFNLGVVCTGVLTTLAYFGGVPATVSCAGLGLLGAIGLGWRVRVHVMRNPRSLHHLLRDPCGWLFLIACAFLIAPALSGGLQFSLFQGNHFDTFNYLESAYSYGSIPYRRLLELSPLEIEAANAFAFGQANLAYRPTVAIAYGILAQADPENFLGNHYAFLVAFQVVFVASLACLIRSMAPDAAAWRALALASLITCGFWGQYILDINAWSQIAWMPLATFALTLLLRGYGESVGSRSQPAYVSVRESLPLALVLIGMIYFYPEGTAFLSPAFATVAVAGSFRSQQGRRKTLAWAKSFLLLSPLLIPILESNLLFLLRQAGEAAKPVDWWKYFHVFLGGRDGLSRDLLPLLSDGTISVGGAYFLTPPPGLGSAGALAWRLILLASVVALCALVWQVYSSVPNLRRRGVLCLLMFGVLALETTSLVARGTLWSAGKSLTFFVPMALACLLAFGHYGQRITARLIRRLGLSVIAVWGLSQVGFAGWRLVAARAEHGIHGSPPYPAVASTKVKSNFNYSDLGFLDPLDQGALVALDIPDPWILSYVRLQLYTHGIAAYSEGHACPDRAAGASIGQVQAPRAPDIRISLRSIARSNPGRTLHVQSLHP